MRLYISDKFGGELYVDRALADDEPIDALFHASEFADLHMHDAFPAPDGCGDIIVTIGDGPYDSPRCWVSAEFFLATMEES